MRYSEIINEAHVSDDTETTGFYNPEDDAFDHHDLGDDRKPKLTLRMVNRLKKIRSTKDLELAKKQDLLGIMYGLGQDEDEV